MAEKESNEEFLDQKPDEAAEEVDQEEEEKIYTGKEIIEHLDEQDLQEKIIYGSQDVTVCTWPEGYKPRQPLFSCLTCCPEEPAGVCLGCANNCHDGHNLVELYTKRKFQCDCGNGKFPADNKCTLYEEKTAKNEFNSYNHNFFEKYCTCNDSYPGKLEETMFQCTMCEDWFHLSHQNVTEDSEMWKKIHELNASLICLECAQKFPFLAILEDATEKTCFVKENEPLSRILCMKAGWRNNICSCKQCQDMLEKTDCTFLLDDEDDIDTYSSKNLENAVEISDDDYVNTLIELKGRDATINILQGVNNLKENLRKFVAEKGDQVITEQDVRGFFDQIKRPRLDPDAE